jgi:hypothetical protein
VALHWLKNNLTRVSRAIAIKRFKGDNWWQFFEMAFYYYLINYHWYIGAHTYDRIVSLLHSVIQTFQLEGKVKHSNW